MINDNDLESQKTNQEPTKDLEPVEATQETAVENDPDLSPEEKADAAINAYMDGQAPAQQDKPAEPSEAEQAATETPAEEIKKRKIRADGRDIEVTEEELVRLASAGVDYTKKTQDLQQRYVDLGGFQSIAQRMQNDPEYARHILSYGTGSAQQHVAPQTKTEDDPVAAFKQEILRDVLGQVAPALAPVADMQRARGMQAIVQELNQSYGDDGALLEATAEKYLDQQPPAIKAAIFQNLSSSPQAMRQGLKELYDALLPTVQAGKKTQVAPVADNKAASPQRPPVVPLESSGAASEDLGKGKGHEKELSAISRKMKNNQASNEDVERYFLLRMGL